MGLTVACRMLIRLAPNGSYSRHDLAATKPMPRVEPVMNATLFSKESGHFAFKVFLVVNRERGSAQGYSYGNVS